MKKAFWALLFVSLILTSCKNFLEAGDIKEQIEKTITYNNAKSFPLVISQETTMGSFLSSGEKECKLEYSITVQFNVIKETYIFKGLKAVKATMYSNEQLTTSKNDQNAIRIWENMGMETGLKLLNKNINEDESHSHYEVGEGIELPDTNSWHNVGIETYGSENLDLIPKGYYYTIIFHFADGSTAMTEIKQKK